MTDNELFRAFIEAKARHDDSLARAFAVDSREELQRSNKARVDLGEVSLSDDTLTFTFTLEARGFPNRIESSRPCRGEFQVHMDAPEFNAEPQATREAWRDAQRLMHGCLQSMAALQEGLLRNRP